MAYKHCGRGLPGIPRRRVLAVEPKYGEFVETLECGHSNVTLHREQACRRACKACEMAAKGKAMTKIAPSYAQFLITNFGYSRIVDAHGGLYFLENIAAGTEPVEISQPIMLSK